MKDHCKNKTTIGPYSVPRSDFKCFRLSIFILKCTSDHNCVTFDMHIKCIWYYISPLLLCMLYNPYSCSINLLHVHIYAGNYDRGEASLSLSTFPNYLMHGTIILLKLLVFLVVFINSQISLLGKLEDHVW